jgi:hypothetical protein
MDQKFQDALKRANDEVEKSGISDPDLRKVAFSKAVDYYLDELLSPSNSFHGVQYAQAKEAPFWSNLSSSTKIDETKLRDIYSIKGGQVLLILRALPGNSNVDRQRSLAALVLLAYQEGLKYEWVTSGLLCEAAKNSDLYDPSRFSRNLNFEWFRSTGKKRGVKYKLSGPGVGAAIDLLMTEVKKG